jgi:sulfur-oxidizing protein SoxB
MASAAAAGLPLAEAMAGSADQSSLYDFEGFGDVRLLHLTDCHAQLNPVYYREPNVNLGAGTGRGKAPHLVGEALLRWAGLESHSIEAHAFSHLEFPAAAKHFGRMGGFAHLRSLVKRLRGDYGEKNTLLLDGGDTWQGSGLALWTRGQDMVGACNLLGVDLMTGHWEFTYRDDEVRANIDAFQGEFLAQNVRVAEEALFDGAAAWDEDSGHAFKSCSVRELNGRRIAVIGQAFPYTPIAHPAGFIPDWRFGIREAALQSLVTELRQHEGADAVVLLSHNGMAVDLKIAARVRGIDAILGGHTHDGLPRPIVVDNPGGKTLVTNAGSNGKFLAVLDLQFSDHGLRDYRYRLLPVFSRYLPADREMADYVQRVRQPHLSTLQQPLAHSSSLLYRRNNFGGTFDQLICDALMERLDAEIALTPGFRWGTTVLPGRMITMEDLLDQTAITYPQTYVRSMRGEELKSLLEQNCDNVFNADPYRQQGGDMVRFGGLHYRCNPYRAIGKRIDELRLESGESLEASRQYRVAGWASTAAGADGPPVWEPVAAYLRNLGKVQSRPLDNVSLSGVRGDPGIEDFAGEQS